MTPAIGMRYGQASRTAMVVAYWRSLADLGITSVPNFSDPQARRLLATPGWRFMNGRAAALARKPESPLALGIRPWVDGVVLRVAFIDAVIAERGIRQLVILGAGLDTRAWRLPALRGGRVFEVDHPATQAYKRAHVAALGPALAQVEFVAVDFARDDLARALAAAGHDPSVPTLWVWEGVIMYLDDAALRGTLAVIRELSAAGSTLLAHYHEPEQTAYVAVARRLMFSWLGEPQVGVRKRQTLRDELVRAGFQVIEDAGLSEQAARVGAQLPLNPKLQVSRIMVAAS